MNNSAKELMTNITKEGSTLVTAVDPSETHQLQHQLAVISRPIVAVADSFESGQKMMIDTTITKPIPANRELHSVEHYESQERLSSQMAAIEAQK